jgi:hypothetical protein
VCLVWLCTPTAAHASPSQAAYTGAKGERAQQVALGSTVAAAVLAIAGVTLGVLLNRPRRR